jgi:hypothetical protein
LWHKPNKRLENPRGSSLVSTKQPNPIYKTKKNGDDT